MSGAPAWATQPWLKGSARIWASDAQFDVASYTVLDTDNLTGSNLTGANLTVTPAAGSWADLTATGMRLWRSRPNLWTTAQDLCTALCTARDEREM